MAAKKSTKGILIYNLLMKEVTKINKLLPEDRKLSVHERRQFISNKIYPKYKNQTKSKIKLTPLREGIIRSVKRLPKKAGCDVLAIPQPTYIDIPYYDIEQLLGTVLPNCIFVKVDAGEFGETTIFNTRDFNYYSTGLSEITNRINNRVRLRNMRSSTIPDYNGDIELRPGKKNDGSPMNYYLEMTLSVVKTKKPHLKIPHKKRTKQQAKKEANIKQYIRDRIKELKQQKSVFKRIRKEVIKATTDMDNARRNKFIKHETKQEIINQIHKGILNKIEKHYTAGILTEKKYKGIIKQINNAYRKGKGNSRKK